jgi:hypothetical protein
MRKKGKAYRNWWANLKERKKFEDVSGWKHNIKMHLKEIGCDSVYFGQGRLVGSSEHGNESSDSIK